MADIAIAFHWAPRDMDPMSLEELSGWWGRARERMKGPDDE